MEPEGAEPGDTFVTKGRVRLAEAVRHLVDATLTAENASSEQLAAAAAKVERIATALHGRGELGDRPSGVRSRQEESHDDYLPRSPLVGVVSPLAPPVEYEYRDGRLLGRGVFHAAYEGPPGYVHGGWIALGFDEILGMANIASGHPGMTGRLSVRYRRPTPLHRPMVFEGWTDQVDGRRVVTRGTLTVDGSITAEAEGLFVVIDLDRAVEHPVPAPDSPAPPDGVRGVDRPGRRSPCRDPRDAHRRREHHRRSRGPVRRDRPRPGGRVLRRAGVRAPTVRRPAALRDRPRAFR